MAGDNFDWSSVENELSGASSPQADHPPPDWGNISNAIQNEPQTIEPTVASTVAAPFVGFNKGIAMMAGAPVDMLSGAYNLVARKTGLPEISHPFGGSESIMSGMGYMGADPRTMPPRGNVERYLQAAGEGAGAVLAPEAMLPAIGELGLSSVAPRAYEAAQSMFGAPSTMGAVARDASAGAMAGVGGQAAADVAPDQYKGIARLAGSMAGAAPFAAFSAAPLSAKEGPTGLDIAQAAERAGVDMPRAAISESTAVQMAGQGLKNIPVAGVPLVNASKKAMEQLGDRANELAEYLGGASPEGAGATAKDAIERWVGPTSKSKVGAAYDAVDKYVDPSVKTQPTATLQTAQNILLNRRAAALPEDSPAIKQVMDAATRPDGLTYPGIKLLRTSIGEQLNSGILPADVSRSELKQLYGSLTDDLKTSVYNSGGQQAYSAFNRANTYNNLVQQRRENLVRLLGGDAATRSDEGVFAALTRAAGSKSSADAKLLEQARKTIPNDEWTDIMSGVIGQMGRDSKGNFSADRFGTAYNNFSDKGKDIIFGGKGTPVRNSIDDINTVSSRFSELNKYANPSGTAHGAGYMALGESALAHPITTLAGVIGGRALSQYLSSPLSSRAIADWAKRSGAEVESQFPGFSMVSPGIIGGDQQDQSSPRELTVGPRQAHASGGRTGRVTTAESMINSVDRVRKQINKTTEPLLNQPDEMVVKALDVAHKNLESAQ